MIPVLLFLLLVLWAAVLVPPWIRSRAPHSPQQSIAGFNRRLSVLANRSRDSRPLPGFSAPIPVIPPAARYNVAPGPVPLTSEAQRRRKQILEGLLIGFGVTFFLGFLTPLSFFRVLAVLSLLALGGYVALLLQWKRNRIEGAHKVRSLPRPVSSLGQMPAFERQAR